LPPLRGSTPPAADEDVTTQEVAVPKRSRTASNGEATRRRILTVAERLFAQRGLDAVSVRDITEAAKANTAAIHYHFGSKRKLVVAILERRAGELAERRGVLLDKIESDSRPELRDVIEAMVLPAAEMVADKKAGGRHYIGFLAGVTSHPEYMPLVNQIYDPTVSRYLAALERVTPQLPSEIRALRFALAKVFVNQVLGQPGAPVHHWLEQQAPEADVNITDRIVDFLVGAFREPHTR
jgi:AcrR family transcriptional regulator